jgi:transcriptional regulator with XRE-family HTH domain
MAESNPNIAFSSDVQKSPSKEAGGARERAEDKIKAVARQLGARVRAARRDRSITLEELSTTTDLSAGFLSRLERGEASASIANLIVIAGRLEIPLRDLFEAPETPPSPSYVVTRAQERKQQSPMTAHGYSYQLTSGDLQDQQMSAFELVYPPGPVGLDLEVLTHKGEEVLYLLEGTIEFEIGTATLTLNAGDCVHFSCEQPHRGTNVGPTTAKLLMVVTPVDSVAHQP